MNKKENTKKAIAKEAINLTFTENKMGLGLNKNFNMQQYYQSYFT